MGRKRVGFIGLGAMGLPMARNLLRRGYELHICAHRNRAPVEALLREGAVEHASVAEAVSDCEVIISILPADREMKEVLLDDRVMSALPAEAVWMEMTSGSPGMMKQIDEAYRRIGVRLLDAPVSGGTVGAEKGTLTVMAGGDAEVLEAYRPVLEAMAQHIIPVGGIGAGKALKAINQMLAGIHMIAAAEALALAEKLDIEPGVLKEVIGKSSGASWMLQNKLDLLSRRDFTPGFKLGLMRKDVQIAVQEGAELALPLASLALQLYRMSERETGDRDFSAVGQAIVR